MAGSGVGYSLTEKVTVPKPLRSVWITRLPSTPGV